MLIKNQVLSSVGKESVCNAGDLGLIPRLGRSPGEGNDNALQYFFLENPMDREAWQAAVHGVVGVGHRLATKTHNVRNGDCVSPFSFFGFQLLCYLQ